MSKPRKGPFRFAWRSACQSCKALFQWCYSVLVLLLVTATVFAAYVATLDDIPVPNFIIRELQSQIRKKGVDLRMEGVRFQPNGRIIFEKPELYSPELGSTVVAASSAVAKIKLSHLAFGSISVDELRLSSGRFVIPAMLTPSGEPTTAIRSINFEATRRGQRWNIDYANCVIGDLKLALSGQLDDSLIQLPKTKPDAPKPAISQAILKIAPKVAQVQKELKRLDSPFCTIELSVLDKQQSAEIHIGTKQLRVSPDINIHNIVVRAQYTVDSQLSAKVYAHRAELPRNSKAQNVHLHANWPTNTPPKQLQPSSIHFSATKLTHRGITLPSLYAEVEPGTETHRANLQFSFPDRPIVAQVAYDIATKTSSVDLTAQLDSATLAMLNPIAQELAQQDVTELANLERAIDLHAVAELDEAYKPSHVEAHAFAGPTSVLGASIDYASAHATVEGPQIDIHSIRLRSGEQQGVIKIGYNLDTLLRRILVEGSFDPTMINGWFKPWWTAMWDGMTFPEEGMLTYLDSQAIFKRPDTVFVTGIAHVRDLDLRGIPVEELRTRIFSLFHYVDLYELELDAADGQLAIGEIQFHMDRDIRDEKDKLTGIWIEALSTLDVKNAPNILWEIAEESAKILEPYCYELPPFISARSSSVRHQDKYLNDIDLQLETETGFTFYGFPFDSLDAFVHIDDDVIDIPRAEAYLGGGKVNATAFIIGDGLEVEAQLDQVGFGQALNATNTYFAQDGSETAEGMDPERLLSFGGQIDAQFVGEGLLGDPVSFLGGGDFSIAEADFGSFRLFGLLSSAINALNLPILKHLTTLEFSRAKSPYQVERDIVRFTDGEIDGPGASIKTKGTYNIETDVLDFTARLFPLRNNKVPVITPLLNLPLDLFSNIFEISVGGTFGDPKLSLFNSNTKERIEADPTTPSRDHRPARR
ncbi:AsmA-like C-terminal region-containing protein [Pelagicoccus sp. SDUM812002]|uniref:AsmA-like C-terminal region-containing protein n=1 Tax=Pelagicoccus sp. SDUM812002 TaxID=3041266 RepID=UPI00280E7614|nr:AsmA-like C-terminal region-containing protein [Pelagicoccus sp. SDUM812002]MDQ8185844.1 AsmA-like C-terminal region-containing protein [Pelagicoccus sp. SDUM812002]